MTDGLPVEVPAPVAPDDRDAWYAPAVRAQYHVGSGVVATITEADGSFCYRTRAPVLGRRDAALRDRIERRFDDSHRTRPRTRDGARERLQEGLPGRWFDHLDRLADRPPAARRRLAYHLGASLRALGALTPLALDDRIRIADAAGDRVRVHTEEFAPVQTDLPADSPHLERFLGERLDREVFEVFGTEVPVTILQRRVLGSGTSTPRYAVEEPDLLPGDRAHIERVREQIRDAPPDSVGPEWEKRVLDRSRRLLGRRLRYADTGRVIRGVKQTVRSIVASVGLAAPGPAPPPRSDRIGSLSYYVARDLLGDGPLTVPLRDDRVRSIEVTDGGERVTVVPHRDSAAGGATMGSNRSMDPATFRRLARSLAAEGGVELSAAQPQATVDLERPGTEGERAVRGSISLPAGEDTGHIALRARPGTAPTPISFLERGALTPRIVAAIWTVAANRGTVVVVGPAGSDPTRVLAAHVPFIPPADRPVSVGYGRRPVPLPHDTGITIHREPGTAAPSVLDRPAMDPDVAVVAGVDDEDSIARFGDVVAAGLPAVAAGQVRTRDLFASLAARAEVPDAVLQSIDLLVELPAEGTEGAATGWLPGQPNEDGDSAHARPADAPSTEISWTRLGGPDADVATGLPGSPGDEAAADDGPGPRDAAVERRRQYVEYLQAEGITERDPFLAFLSDLRTDEAATVERIRRRLDG